MLHVPHAGQRCTCCTICKKIVHRSGALLHGFDTRARHGWLWCEDEVLQFLNHATCCVARHAALPGSRSTLAPCWQQALWSTLSLEATMGPPNLRGARSVLPHPTATAAIRPCVRSMPRKLPAASPIASLLTIRPSPQPLRSRRAVLRARSTHSLRMPRRTCRRPGVPACPLLNARSARRALRRPCPQPLEPAFKARTATHAKLSLDVASPAQRPPS
eukprot:352393-Chlamydomonas_euryale.AAC.6